MFDESPTEPVTDEQRQISADLITAMQSKISEALEAESVNVDDVYGNHQHVNIRVVSAQFDGKNAVQRQRMVYKVRACLCAGVCASSAAPLMIAMQGTASGPPRRRCSC